MIIKNILKYLVFRHKRNNKTYIKYLNSIGAKVSQLAYFVAPNKITIDETRPYLIEIGDYVTITEGCVLLTHGFDWSVLKVKYGEVIGSAGKITIKNNVFIGVNSVILKGVTIGENTIIGAGSVVTKSIPSNVVAAGNPCRVISSLEDYYYKRQKEEVSEAKNLVKEYYKKYGKYPDNNIMAEFLWLYSSTNDIKENSIQNKLKYGGNFKESLQLLYNSTRKYNSLESLCKEVINTKDEE